MPVEDKEGETLTSAFERLTGRLPTDADVLRLYQVQSTLRLGDNDALWLLFIALNHFQSLYEQIPAQIKETTKEVLETTETAARKTIEAEAATAHRNLTEQVADSAKEVAGKMASREKWRAVAITAGVLLALLIGAAVYVEKVAKATWFNAGYHAGTTEVYKVVDKHAEAWAGSPDGRLARLLFDAGVLKYESLVPDPMIPTDLAVVSRSGANWLHSEPGRKAQALRVETLDWGGWLQGLLDNGLLFEGEGSPTPRCAGTLRGYSWRISPNPYGGQFCDVWHGRVYVVMPD